MRKQGTIRVCIYYRYINKDVPKDNYPTPFIDQIVDDCTKNEMFSFMDRFSRYNQINILPSDQHKITFIFPWGNFSYRKIPFGLKNVSTTFQRAMSYAFDDIKHIVQNYLDDLSTHSKKHQDHPIHLRAIFLWCRHYNICLNWHKYVFCVESGRILSFVVSKEGIHIDPLKVQVILNLPTPSNLRQFQILCSFVPNYAELTKGFTQLLKQRGSFSLGWHSPKIFWCFEGCVDSDTFVTPPNYHRDYFLYLVASDNTIAIVFVQEDDANEEHVI